MNTEPLVIDVSKKTTKVDWVLLITGEADAPTVRLYQTEDGEPTQPICNIELEYTDEDVNNILRADIPIMNKIQGSSYKYQKNNPIRFINAASKTERLSCLSLISTSDSRQKLKLCFKCVLDEDADLEFYVVDSSGASFISVDPGLIFRRKPR